MAKQKRPRRVAARQRVQGDPIAQKHRRRVFFPHSTGHVPSSGNLLALSTSYSSMREGMEANPGLSEGPTRALHCLCLGDLTFWVLVHVNIGETRACVLHEASFCSCTSISTYPRPYDFCALCLVRLWLRNCNAFFPLWKRRIVIV